MKNTHWTPQDVERFREQQRWRLRQKTHQHQQIQLPTPTISNITNNFTNDRPRKVSLKFRREHEQFVSKHDQAQSPRTDTVAVTTRPAFSITLPSSFHGPHRAVKSPVPLMNHSLFNAFDSTASPEAFSLEKPTDQDEHQMVERNSRFHLNEDHDMASEDDDEELSDSGQHAESLWRRRFFVQGTEKRSPKLGRVALWEAGRVLAGKDACTNEFMEMVRVPLPFAEDDDSDEL